MIHSHALIKVACKIFGLMFLVNVVSMLGLIPQGFLMIQADTPASGIYIYFALPFLYLIFAYVFIKYADAIAQKLDPVEREIEISPDNNWPQVLYKMGMRLIGVYMVFTGVPKIIKQGIIFLFFVENKTMPWYLWIRDLPSHLWSEGIAAIIYMGLGIYLLAGGSLLSKLENVMNRNND